MKQPNRFAQGTLTLCAAALLGGCVSVPPQQVFHDPYQRYPLGQTYACNESGTLDMRLNSENSSYPGLGCSHQSNMTLMVANAGDLSQARTMTPPDHVARARVLQAYRDGEATSVAPDAEGAANLLGSE